MFSFKSIHVQIKVISIYNSIDLRKLTKNFHEWDEFFNFRECDSTSENYENSFSRVKICNVNFRKSIELWCNSGVQEKQRTTNSNRQTNNSNNNLKSDELIQVGEVLISRDFWGQEFVFILEWLCWHVCPQGEQTGWDLIWLQDLLSPL